MPAMAWQNLMKNFTTEVKSPADFKYDVRIEVRDPFNSDDYEPKIKEIIGIYNIHSVFLNWIQKLKYIGGLLWVFFVNAL